VDPIRNPQSAIPLLPLPAILGAALDRALRALPEPPPADFSAPVTAAADPRFGNYQANAAMALAKIRKVNPRELAAEIVERLKGDAELAKVCGEPTIAGPGFINFTLRPEFLAERTQALLNDKRLGVSKVESPKKIVIDFSSPNIAKPMHVGHLRSTLIGECLSRVARFLGHKVIADNHLGDWGTQFGKVIFGWKHALNQDLLAADALAELVRIYQFANTAAENDPVAANACREELAKLQAGDPTNVDIWKECVRISRADLDRIYARLGVHFDYQLGESHFNPRLASLVDELMAKGIARESEGAICIFFPDDPKLAEKPAIIRKRDGAFNYTTTDLATLELRVKEWGATALWYVVGAPQTLHFEQLNAAARQWGVDVPITHIPFGNILGEDRKIMRTRSGENVALGDLLDEAETRAGAVIAERNPELPEADRASAARIIGLGAVKYAELSQHRLSDYVFAWDRMLSFQGNTAPYLQNAYVRIRSIFRRSEAAFAMPERIVLTEPAEHELAKKLAQFTEAVPAVLEDFRPNQLAHYLYELANVFHGFYEACPVLKAEGDVRATRLALCELTARVLRTGLDLLGVAVPERM
jgi:arginyl-tRNA synthetase